LIDAFAQKLKKFPEFLEEIAFETYKKQLKKKCYNTFIESHKFNAELRTSIIQNHFRTNFDVYQGIDNVKYEDLKEFSIKFLKELQIQLLIQGNLKKEHALEITENILKVLQCQQIEDVS
jgi:secreted Zn-dependent insulinase-like peptidase